MLSESWTCHVCGREQPDAVIAVRKTDRSAEWKMPPGTFVENVRYCSDQPACVEGSKTHRFVDPPTPAMPRLGEGRHA
jgi:hypothetical protein